MLAAGPFRKAVHRTEQAPKGFMYHMADIYWEELLKLFGKVRVLGVGSGRWRQSGVGRGREGGGSGSRSTRQRQQEHETAAAGA